MLIVGLISFIIYWVFIVHIFRKWGFDSYLTISDHVSSGHQRKVYNPTAMILLTIFVVYTVFGVLPKHNTSHIAYILVITAWLCELLVIQFPRLGKHFLFHDRLTLVVGCSLYALIAVIGLGSRESSLTHWITGFRLLVLAVMSMPIVKQKKRKNFLFFQSFYFAGLQVFLLYFGIISVNLN